MATYRGGEVPEEDFTDKLLRLRGRPARAIREMPDELNYPGWFEDQRLDYMPKPGVKGYDPRDQMAQAGGNALSRFWTPEHEQDFQTYMAFDPNVRQWRNAFANQYGEKPQIEGGDFNYRQAYLAGNGPKPNAHDVVPHWQSTGKSADHPTAWKETFMQAFGADPDALAPQQWTQPMQQFMQREIGGNTVNALARGRR